MTDNLGACGGGRTGLSLQSFLSRTSVIKKDFRLHLPAGRQVPSAGFNF